MRFFGDVFVYSRNQAEIHGRMWQAIADWQGADWAGPGYGTEGRPINVIAHSLGGKRGRIHPATKSFQALRIAVNDELGSLESSKAFDLHHVPARAPGEHRFRSDPEPRTPVGVNAPGKARAWATK